MPPREITMPQTPHVERHFTGSATVRDIVIGMSDGLTVPFALAAGLSGAVDKTSIIVMAGLAELAAGSISMGLGGYLAAKSDAEHYDSEQRREESEVKEIPEAEAAEVRGILQSYGLTGRESNPIVASLRKRPSAWVDFMMRFELGLERPDPRRALTSAATIAGAYAAGGFIPLGPYIFFPRVSLAFAASIGITALALATFGYVKAHFTGASSVRSSVQTVLIGGLAAAAAFLIARAIS
jgi:VIT1/CCC1 family predicted Fe2+/Mn2+ transporter